MNFLELFCSALSQKEDDKREVMQISFKLSLY